MVTGVRSRDVVTYSKWTSMSTYGGSRRDVRMSTHDHRWRGAPCRSAVTVGVRHAWLSARRSAPMTNHDGRRRRHRDGQHTIVFRMGISAVLVFTGSAWP